MVTRISELLLLYAIDGNMIEKRLNPRIHRWNSKFCVRKSFYIITQTSVTRFFNPAPILEINPEAPTTGIQAINYMVVI